MTTKNARRRIPRSLDYKADLLAELRSDPDYAAKYLSAARDDSDVSFRIALRDVIEARMGMKKAAKAAKLNREHLYRALSSRGNPSDAMIDTLLGVLGFGVGYFASRKRPTPSSVPALTETRTIRLFDPQANRQFGGCWTTTTLAGGLSETQGQQGAAIEMPPPYMIAAQIEEPKAATIP